MNLRDEKQSQCHCIFCQSMCKQSPCFGTPQDVFAQIIKGHGEKLAFTIFVDTKTNQPYPLVAPLQK